jgi:hypothetical protein
MNAIPVTCLLCVYNEEHRILPVLKHATQWADEVLVLDKQSTDRTREICETFPADNIRIVEIPFTPKGQEDTVALIGMATHKWVYIGTASEIPTRALIRELLEILHNTAGSLDLVYVPRRIYSFGIHSPDSPWSVAYYPFLINREKSIVRNVIHNNYRPSNPLNVAKVEYRDDCCVHHFAHPTAETYVRDMSQYFGAETSGTPDELRDRLAKCMDQVNRFQPSGKPMEDEMFGLSCAWQFYWLGTALFIWEKLRGVDVPALYNQLRGSIVQQEWSAADGAPPVTIDTPLPGKRKAFSARIGYLVELLVTSARRRIRGK